MEDTVNLEANQSGGLKLIEVPYQKDLWTFRGALVIPPRCYAVINDHDKYGKLFTKILPPYFGVLVGEKAKNYSGLANLDDLDMCEPVLRDMLWHMVTKGGGEFEVLSFTIDEEIAKGIEDVVKGFREYKVISQGAMKLSSVMYCAKRGEPSECASAPTLEFLAISSSLKRNGEAVVKCIYKF
ncbi:MAG TPA: hypothetical protein VJI46_04100 [Candidatus Nanoarchaeia archaeon]|nr:hypothetical protein [Candidatus Nanoarchaeia archaeon]